MKNLLTKISFILLLLSAVIPFGVQAGFSTASCAKFDKTGLVTALLVGVAEVAESAVLKARGKTTLSDTLGTGVGVAIAIEIGTIAVIGVVAGVTTGTGVRPAIGAGVGALVGALVGGKIVMQAVGVVGVAQVAAIAGAAIGAVKGKKVVENYLKKSHTGKVIGCTT